MSGVLDQEQRWTWEAVKGGRRSRDSMIPYWQHCPFPWSKRSSQNYVFSIDAAFVWHLYFIITNITWPIYYQLPYSQEFCNGPSFGIILISVFPLLLVVLFGQLTETLHVTVFASPDRTGDKFPSGWNRILVFSFYPCQFPGENKIPWGVHSMSF